MAALKDFRKLQLKRQKKDVDDDIAGGHGLMDDIAGGSCEEAPTAAIDTHSPHSGSPAPSNEETPEAEGVVIVSTLDFHNFGVDRTNVKEDQVWAIYDGKDSMPQFNCLVTKITQEPFNVLGRWLESIHPLIPFTTFHWLQKLDLAWSPGEFRLDHEVEFDTFGTFSHLMAMKRDNTILEIYSKGFETCDCFDVRVEKPDGYRASWKHRGYPFLLITKHNLHKFLIEDPASTP